MSNNPAIWRRNALIGSVMVLLALWVDVLLALPGGSGPAPRSPTDLVGRVTSNSVTLFWKSLPTGGDQSHGLPDIPARQQDEPQRRTSRSCGLISGIDGPPTSFRDSNKMGGSRDYQYAVAAVNDDGESVRTNQFRALVPANYINDAETWRSHSLTGTRLQWRW